jgi:CMP-N-acetylneuraminic acid synthetase
MISTLAMIPARMGSQRLKQKNLRELDGVPLIVRVIRKCQAAGCFDEIFVNSEDEAFRPIAEAEGVRFYQRPKAFGGNDATSEEFLADFFQNIECDRLVQVHSIAPLLTASEVSGFVEAWAKTDHDVMLSCIHDQIEVAFQGQPVNFTFAEKTNSQDLIPVQRITWPITGWRRATYLAALAAGRTGSYAGSIGFYPVSAISGHVIKTERDLKIAEALLPIVLAESGA